MLVGSIKRQIWPLRWLLDTMLSGLLGVGKMVVSGSGGWPTLGGLSGGRKDSSGLPEGIMNVWWRSLCSQSGQRRRGSQGGGEDTEGGQETGHKRHGWTTLVMIMFFFSGLILSLNRLLEGLGGCQTRRDGRVLCGRGEKEELEQSKTNMLHRTS